VSLIDASEQEHAQRQDSRHFHAEYRRRFLCAKPVLPMLTRASIAIDGAPDDDQITRCRPEVISSSCLNPVAMPVHAVECRAHRSG